MPRAMPLPDKIPEPAVRRLSLYLRELRAAHESGKATILSTELGSALGLAGAQVRKDLGVFGQFGQAGVGYPTQALIARLRNILGKEQQWNACIVGAGNIGRALLSYNRFRGDDFDIVAIFDQNPAVIGTRVADHRVRPLEDLPALVRERTIRIGIVAVPAEAAQETAVRLIDAGVAGILNFAPRRLDVADRVSVVNVDFTVALEQLAFQVSLGLTGTIGDAKK